MTYDAGSRKDIRRAEKASKLVEQQSREIIAGIMSVSPGRAWVLRKLESAHVFETSFATDALAMAFKEGERNQGLMLLNDIMSICPDEYVLMMRERNETDAARRTAAERSSQPNLDGGDQGSSDSGDNDGVYRTAESGDEDRTNH